MVHLELPDNWQDLATGYVLNNLSEEEAWIWDMLLREYPELHQDVQQLDRVFNSLADVVPRHQPPPNLLQKIHSTIATQPNQAQALQSQSFHAQVPQSQLPQPSQRQSSSTLESFSKAPSRRKNNPRSISKRLNRRPVQSLSRQPLSQTPLSKERSSFRSGVAPSRRGNRMVQIGGVIAAGIIAVIGLQLQRLQTQLQQTETELQQATTQIRSLNRQLRQAESLTQYTRPVVQTLQQPGSLIYSMAGSNLANTASGRLIMSEEQKVVIVVQNLPPLPEGKVYRLWAALQSKDVVYCGQFNSNAEGIIQLTPSSDHCGENPSQMIITLDAVTDPTTQGGPVVMQGRI